MRFILPALILLGSALATPMLAYKKTWLEISSGPRTPKTRFVDKIVQDARSKAEWKQLSPAERDKLEKQFRANLDDDDYLHILRQNEDGKWLEYILHYQGLKLY